MLRLPTHTLALLTLCGTLAAGGTALGQPDRNERRDRDDRREHREDRGERDEKRERDDRRERHAERADRSRQRGPQGGMQRGMIRHLFGNLDLDSEQGQAIRGVMQDFREQAMEWRETHREELAELRQRMVEAQEARNREAAIQAYRDLLDLTESRPRAVDAFDRIREVLNEEQVAQFDRNLQAMRERAGGRQHEGNGRGADGANDHASEDADEGEE